MKGRGYRGFMDACRAAPPPRSGCPGCCATSGVMRGIALAVALAAVTLGAGCMVGPDFHRPAAPQVDGYSKRPLPARTASADVTGGLAQHFVQGQDIPEQWWKLFHSQALNALIEQSLKANPDVHAAQAALRFAMENVYAQMGAYYPSVQAGFATSRQKNAVDVISPTLTSGAAIFNLYTAQLNVSYVPDVFGGTRRQVESLRAQAESQRFALEATYLTLTSNVVAAAVQEASLREQLAATQKVIDIQSEALELFRRQYDLGAIAMADVVAQEAALAQTRATLIPLRKQLALQRDLLARLAGRFPSEEPAQNFELSSLELPEELPVSLPSRLVEQRPDVRAAEAQLHAASAQVGVAIADMLPQFTLSAGIGSTAVQLGKLFTSNTQFWSVGGSFAQTIFDGGSLLHKKQAAVAVMDQSAAQYRSTVLTAFQNVADTLRVLEYDADAVQAQAAAEQAAAQSLRIARESLALGAISYLSLLNAQMTYEQAVVNLAQAQGNRYADTAALFQALGGGWWNRQEVASSPN